MSLSSTLIAESAGTNDRRNTPHLKMASKPAKPWLQSVDVVISVHRAHGKAPWMRSIEVPAVQVPGPVSLIRDMEHVRDQAVAEAIEKTMLPYLQNLLTEIHLRVGYECVGCGGTSRGAPRRVQLELEEIATSGDNTEGTIRWHKDIWACCDNSESKACYKTALKLKKQRESEVEAVKLECDKGRPFQVKYECSANCGVITFDREKDMKRCSGCKIAIYCSPECQKRDWKRHKEQCIPATRNKSGK